MRHWTEYMTNHFVFILNSVLFGAGLAMDAFSVSVANGLAEGRMPLARRLAVAGTFGAFQTAMPLLGATLIAILAFWPIFLSPDTAGVYVRDLFIVIAVSLMLSWILALTHVPIMADQFFSGKKQTAAEDEDAPKKDPYDGRTYRALEQVLRFGLKFRWLTVAIAIGLLVVSVLC